METWEDLQMEWETALREAQGKTCIRVAAVHGNRASTLRSHGQGPQGEPAAREFSAAGPADGLAVADLRD